MKQLFALAFLVASTTSASALTELKQTYVVLNFGGADNYYAGNQNQFNNTKYTEINLGPFTGSEVFVLKGAEIQTFKSGEGMCLGEIFTTA